MILSSHLGKEERKDNSDLPLTLMLELSSVTGDSAKTWAWPFLEGLMIQNLN